MITYNKKYNYMRKGRGYSLDELLPYIQREEKDTPKDLIKRNFDGDLIKVTSDRYFVFQKSAKCVKCGIEGTVLFKEQSKGQQTYHFNLYAICDGEEILMTKDHIIPKSKGGKNSLDNYQTMCNPCNVEKGNIV